MVCLTTFFQLHEFISLFGRKYLYNSLFVKVVVVKLVKKRVVLYLYFSDRHHQRCLYLVQMCHSSPKSLNLTELLIFDSFMGFFPYYGQKIAFFIIIIFPLLLLLNRSGLYFLHCNKLYGLDKLNMARI